MFGVLCLGILVNMALALVRAAKGPTVFDRILAVNNMGSKTVLLIAALGYLTGRPDFLDLAMIYVLINFIGTIAILKFVKYGDLAQSAPGEVES